MKSLTLLLVAALLAGCDGSTKTQNRPDPPSRSDEKRVVIAARPQDPVAEGFIAAAKLAADVERGDSKPIRIDVTRSVLTGPALAGLTDDSGVVTVLTVGGADAIEAAGEAIDESGLPVFELVDDLYEVKRMRPSVFQASTPHSWQSFRLARYFAPSDRAYRRVALLAEPGLAQGESAPGLAENLAIRGIELIEAQTPDQLASAQPQAVVVEGSRGFLDRSVDALKAMPWKPQIAGFESMLASRGLPASTVASGDYARPSQEQPVASAEEFRSAFRKATGRLPAHNEVLAFDAIRLVAEAVRAAGVDRAKMLTQLESVDRKRFGHLTISLGPDDHLLAERDVLGLWALDGDGRWKHLMRTFTSDLERTNILEEDWPAFFDGTTPGGEAPFYHSAKVGITTPPSDDLR